MDMANNMELEELQGYADYLTSKNEYDENAIKFIDKFLANSSVRFSKWTKNDFVTAFKLITRKIGNKYNLDVVAHTDDVAYVIDKDDPRVHVNFTEGDLSEDGDKAYSFLKKLILSVDQIEKANLVEFKANEKMATRAYEYSIDDGAIKAEELLGPTYRTVNTQYIDIDARTNAFTDLDEMVKADNKWEPKLVEVYDKLYEELKLEEKDHLVAGVSKERWFGHGLRGASAISSVNKCLTLRTVFKNRIEADSKELDEKAGEDANSQECAKYVKKNNRFYEFDELLDTLADNSTVQKDENGNKRIALDNTDTVADASEKLDKLFLKDPNLFEYVLQTYKTKFHRINDSRAISASSKETIRKRDHLLAKIVVMNSVVERLQDTPAPANRYNVYVKNYDKGDKKSAKQRRIGGIVTRYGGPRVDTILENNSPIFKVATLPAAQRVQAAFAFHGIECEIVPALTYNDDPIEKVKGAMIKR